ncbi:MAG TPA: dihydrofolate reductase family protein [Flexivirga sp.]|uniref:dihydrofolate reductase family protein n=1 Tax=Flexivirga sp. TaxID=1962927 RepID=UPI002B9005F7|nr:dihydrofolate reductase family protein [Flexivirga sp.]HWC22767.1 dihydrofolate reductase family protein [Flexivirga sp.]
MSKVLAALAVSTDGYITGRNPRPGHGLGDGGVLFDWYGDPGNAATYQQLVDRVGAVVTGRTTYDDCEGFDGGSPHPTAPMVVLSHRKQPAAYADSQRQVFASSIEEAIARGKELANGKDVGMQGGVTVTAAIEAGLVDELILHQVPVLLGGGRPFFRELSTHIPLTLIDTVLGAGVTHLHYRVDH